MRHARDLEEEEAHEDSEHADCGCGCLVGGGAPGAGLLGLAGVLVFHDELEGAAGGLLGLAGPARLLLVLLDEPVEAALDEVVLFFLGLVEAPGDAGELEPEGALVLAVPGGAGHGCALVAVVVCGPGG